MPIIRRQLLHKLDGNNLEIDAEESLVRQVPRTSVGEHFYEEDLQWTDITPDRCDPGVNADHRMVINLTAQARTYFNISFKPPEHKNNTASFSLEVLQQIFDGTRVDEVSRVVMRPNYPELKTMVFHLREITLADGEIAAIVSTRPPIVIFVVKRVKRLVCGSKCLCMRTGFESYHLAVQVGN